MQQPKAPQSDRPATCTYSKTNTPVVIQKPDNTKVNAPQPLMRDSRDTLLQMQWMDPSCKCISRWLNQRKAPHHESNAFTDIDALLYKHAMDASQKFLILVIPKSWCFMVLVEAHEKLGHQESQELIISFSNSIIGRGWTRPSINTLQIAHYARGRKQKHKMYPLQMTDIPDWPFDKIIIDLITDLNISTSGNQHILTVINYLIRWPETFPIPDKKSDTIVHVFINNYLPVHIFPRYILSDKGTVLKINLWVTYYNNFTLITSFLPLTTHWIMAS